MLAAPAVTCTPRSTLWGPIEPLVPVTLSVKVPTEALPPAVIDNGEFAVPPEVGVTGDVTVKLTSEGAVPTQDPESVTAELNPFSDVTMMVAELLPP